MDWQYKTTYNKNMSDILQKTSIHGKMLRYDNKDYDLREGVRYLQSDLDREEILPLFEYAKHHDEAEFEDKRDRQFTIKHNQGIYTLETREK